MSDRKAEPVDCLHCGQGANLIPHSTGESVRWYVQCCHCGIRTGHLRSAEEAAWIWAQRAEGDPA